MHWRAMVAAVGVVILGAGLGWAELPKAESPEGEASEVDPVAEGLRLRQILKRPSVVSGESFAPFGEEAAETPAEPAALPSPASAEDVLPEVQLLRDAAWQLEQTAHQLECRDLYERADQLRQVARELRADARRLRGVEALP